MKKNGKKARKLQKERNLRRSKMREEQALSRTDEIDLTSLSMSQLLPQNPVLCDTQEMRDFYLKTLQEYVRLCSWQDNQMVKAQLKAYPCKEVEDGTAYYYDDNGNLYRIDDNLLPNTEYDINGYRYETDEEGRIVSAEGRLQVKDHEGRPAIKDSIEDIGKGDQKKTDDRGHLIGDQFNGSNGMENMIPQDSDINRKDYKALETELAKEVAAGKEVYVKVEPIYEGDSHRPVAVMVTYTIDGEESVRVFPNEREE